VQDEFVARVQAAGVACTVRDTRGREIAAACGQLAAGGYWQYVMGRAPSSAHPAEIDTDTSGRDSAKGTACDRLVPYGV
jgi:hypothetical protein